MIKFRHLIILPLALGLLACTREVVGTGPAESGDGLVQVPGDALPGTIRIKLDQASDPESLDLSFLGNYTIQRAVPAGTKFEERYRKAGLDRWYNLSFDASLPMTKAAADLSELPGVSDIAYIQRARPAAGYEFNDPYFSRQWHFYNEGIQNGTVAGSDINLLPAWEVTRGSTDVVVAICDSAPEYEHEDLAANMWVNEAEANGTPGVDDDGNGYVDDINGYNFLVEPYKGADLIPGDHGTHIAGVIAAVNNNGVGVNGIAGGDSPDGNGVRLMSIQTSNGNEAAYIGEAIIYAADNGAVLMNCSWSISSNDAYVRQCIDYFNEYAGLDENGNQVGPMAGGVCIFAAGNESTTVSYPAMNDNVIAVASIGADYELAYYSNYGSWVDIAAPGGDANKGFQIYSTVTNASGRYGYMQGTSMACPHVVGVAALIVSHYGGPGFTRDQMVNILLNTANPVVYDYNPSYNGMLGSGLVDAGAAVAGSTDQPLPVDDLEASVLSNAVTLSWTARADNRGTVPFSYDIYWSDSPLADLDPDDPAEGVEHHNLVTGSGVKDGDAMSFSITGLEFNTEYYFRIRTRNMFGGTSELSEEISCRTVGNSAPEIRALDGTSLELKSHETGTLRFEISDADGHELSYSVLPAEEGEGLEGVTASLSEGILTLRINALEAAENSSHSGILAISDSYETTELGFSYSIGENHAPVAASVENLVLNARNESRSYPLSELFSDEDGETLDYEYSISTTNIIVRCSVSDGNFNVDGNSYGSTEVVLSATDARGETATLSFPVLVRDGSRPVDLYPNPVVDMLNVRTGGAVTADITVSNVAGAVVFSQEGAVIDPFAPVQVDMSGLPGGTYYVSVKGEGIDSSSSIAKQ